MKFSTRESLDVRLLHLDYRLLLLDTALEPAVIKVGLSSNTLFHKALARFREKNILLEAPY